MRKKTLLTLLLSLTMATGVQAEELKALTVRLVDGSKVQFVLPVQQPTVTCQESMMTVSYRQGAQADSQAELLSFSRDEVQSLTIDEVDLSRIDEAQADEQRVKFDLTHGRQVLVSGLQSADRLQVFSLDGKSIQVPISRQGSEATVDLTGQARGCYLVTVNRSFTFKLMLP